MKRESHSFPRLVSRRLPVSTRWLQLSRVRRYAVGVGLALAAVALRFALEPVWGLALPYSTMYPAVVLSAWLGGLGAGVVTTGITATAAFYYWLPPTRSWAAADGAEWLGLAAFVLVGVLISALNDVWRRSASRLLSSENRLRVSIASIRDAVVLTDQQDLVLQLNAAAEALTGWPAADAVGQPMYTVVTVRQDPATTRAPLPDGTAASRPSAHATLVSRGGAQVPVDYSRAPVRDDDGETLGAVLVLRDLNEQEQIARERLATARLTREFAAIVESSDDAIVGKDLDGTIRAWNRAAERMFGYTAAEAIGRSIHLIIPRERRNEEAEVLRKIQSGERVDHFETVRCHKDGSDVFVSLTISPIRDGTGAVIGSSKIARDIGERRRVEADRVAILAREHAARLEVERAARLKDEFLAVLSHELRTPLNAVVGYAHLLEAGALSPEHAQHAVAAIRRNAMAQARLVDSLLDLSRVIAGKLELDLQPQSLAAIVEAAVDAIKPEADARRVSIEVTRAPLPILLEGDGPRLQQVFWNLLANAVKFTAPGGRVTVCLSARDADATVQVIDSGQGIPAEALPHIFERFRQADTGKRSRAGLGLGLALVREMIAAHGGTVVAESEGEGRGSTFTVTLPVSSDMRLDWPAGAMPVDDAESLTGVDVLIVDDDAETREIFRFALEARGARTRAVPSAAEAFRAIEAHRPDVLLSDLRMPEEDGYWLIRRVRLLDAGGSRLPAIAVTGYASLRDGEEAIAAGFDVHVAKPVTPADLASVITRVRSPHGV